MIVTWNTPTARTRTRAWDMSARATVASMGMAEYVPVSAD